MAFPETKLGGLTKNNWVSAVRQIAEDMGFFEKLDPRHFAGFVDIGKTLLVSFETIQAMQGLGAEAEPLGWRMARDHGWSHLLLASDGDTWFRTQAIYQFFDRLEDDGFFEDFDQVLFFGAGPCGYAACAYSVAAPGARVLAVQPQATLDPARAGWDDRFRDQRGRDFTSRYGYAPDMIDAADQAYVVFDPHEVFDAMHAALFMRPNVTALRMPVMGGALQMDLMVLEALIPMLRLAAEGALDRPSFARLWRNRRDHLPYLRKLLARLDAHEHEDLALLLCRYVTERMEAPRFARRLQSADGDAHPEATIETAKAPAPQEPRALQQA